MDAHAVFEVRDVVISFFAGVVGNVQANTPIQTDDQECQVVAQTDTRA